MSQRIRSNRIKKRRGFTYLWILVLAVSVCLLIYFEQTSLMYILATLGVTILLVIVATADLGRSEMSSGGPVLSPQTSSPQSEAKARE